MCRGTFYMNNKEMISLEATFAVTQLLLHFMALLQLPVCICHGAA